MIAEELMTDDNRHITGKTRLVGLLGGDVRYSLSLRLHNRAFEALGLDWARKHCYVATARSKSRLERAFWSV